MDFFKEYFKNLLWNRWTNFEIISQDCSLGDPLQKLFAKFWSSKNIAAFEGGGRAGEDTDMKKFFKNLLWNPWLAFEIISQECSMGDPS